jgi:hypothetical protein
MNTLFLHILLCPPLELSYNPNRVTYCKKVFGYYSTCRKCCLLAMGLEVMGHHFGFGRKLAFWSALKKL